MHQYDVRDSTIQGHGSVAVTGESVQGDGSLAVMGELIQGHGSVAVTGYSFHIRVGTVLEYEISCYWC